MICRRPFYNAAACWWCDVTSTPPTELMTDDAAGDRTQHGAGKTILVLYWRTVSDGHIATFLTRGLDGFFDRRGSEYLRVLRTGRENVKTGNRSNTQSGCNTNTHTG